MRTEYLERLKASPLAARPPWTFVTSAELHKALGVHMQTLSNWRLREVGPTPAPSGWFRGRASRYNLGHVWCWAYEQAGQRVTPGALNANWLRDHMGFGDWENPAAVGDRVRLLMRLSKTFRPQELTRLGARELGN